MDEILIRVAEDLADRLTGPMKFRLVLQPLMAAIMATRDGLRDARAGRPPYLWGLLWTRHGRMDMLKDGWRGVGRIVALALALDVFYQLLVLGAVYPGEAVLVACVLAIFPYALLRGPIARAARSRAKYAHMG
jgi:hypothetical protein